MEKKTDFSALNKTDRQSEYKCAAEDIKILANRLSISAALSILVLFSTICMIYAGTFKPLEEHIISFAFFIVLNLLLITWLFVVVGKYRLAKRLIKEYEKQEKIKAQGRKKKDAQELEKKKALEKQQRMAEVIARYIDPEEFPPLPVVRFGRYRQKSDSDEKQPIEWYCLAEEKGKTLLLSKYALISNSCVADRNGWKVNPWQSSGFRSDLNKSFFQEAFSDDERNRIIPQKICPGHADHIFLLSCDQVNLYLKGRRERLCSPTEISGREMRRPYQPGPDTLFRLGEEEYCNWWLRDVKESGSGIQALAGIGDFGWSNSYYEYRMGAEIAICYGVRPAMWINGSLTESKSSDKTE